MLPLYVQSLVGPDQPVSFETFVEAVHPDDREWVDELWRQLVIDHVPVECEHRVLRPDGKVRTFRCHGAAIIDPSGSLRLVGTVQDVTERTRLELELRAAVTRAEALPALLPSLTRRISSAFSKSNASGRLPSPSGTLT